MKTLSRDDTEHGVEYVTLNEAEREIASLQRELDNARSDLEQATKDCLRALHERNEARKGPLVGFCRRCGHFEPDHETHRICPDCGKAWGVMDLHKAAFCLFGMLGEWRRCADGLASIAEDYSNGRAALTEYKRMKEGS